MAEISQQGTTLKYGSTLVAELMKITAPELDRKDVETTHLGTTVAKTFRPSKLYDPGELSGTVQYDPTDATHVHFSTAMTAATVETWTVTWSDGSLLAGSGFLTKFKSGEAEQGDSKNLEAEFTIKLSGAVTFTPFAGP